MAGNTIKGITIEIGGNTTKLGKALEDVNKRSRDLQKELKNVNSLLKYDPNNAELLNQKQQILNETITATKEKLETLKNAQQQVQDQFSRGEITAEQYRSFQREIVATENKLKSLESQQNNSKSSVDELSNTINKQEKELGQLEKEYTNVVLEQGKNSREAGELKNKISELNNELKQNKSKLKEAEDATAELTREFNEVSQEADEMSDSLETAFAIEGVDNLTETFSGIAVEVMDFGVQSQTSLNSLQAQLGLTNEEADKFKEIVHEIYADNFGEDLDEIANSMAQVHQQTSLTGDALKTATENGYLLSDTFGIEINDSAKAAQVMMKTFGITADEAYNLMAQGAQNGLNENDDLMDILQEYSPMFEQAGYSAEDMLNALANGMEEGAFTADLLADGMKEFTLLLQDGSADDALKELGYSADEFKNKFAEGGETAKNATSELIGKLAQIKDPIEQNKLGVALFGTKWEDLKNSAVLALNDTEGAIDSTKDALGEINAIKYNDLNSNIEAVKRAFLEDLQPVISLVIDALNNLAQFFLNLPQPIQQLISIVGALGVAFVGITTVIGMISSVVGIFTSGWQVLTGVFAAVKVGAAGLAGVIGGISAPVLIVVGVIAGLIAAGVALYKNWDTVKEKAAQLSSFVGAKFDSIKSKIDNAINGAKDTVKNAVDKMKSFFDFKWSLPKIKLPHFSVSGSANPIDWLSKGVPKINVQWYAKGGILTEPTVFGMNGNTLLAGGESGDEAVLPLSNFYNYLDKKLENNNNEIDYNRMTKSFIKAVQNMDLRIDMNAEEVGRLTSVHVEKDIKNRTNRLNRLRGE